MERFQQIKSCVDWELERIMEIPNGAKAFCEMAEFMNAIKNHYSKLSKKRCCRYNFRGPVAASMVAYLCGITELEPLELYSWVFFRKKMKEIRFDLNVTIDMYNRMMDYYSIVIPSCVVLHIGVDISILEQIEKWSDTEWNNSIISWQERKERYNEEIARFCLNDTINGTYSKFHYLNDFTQCYVPQIVEILEFLKFKDKLPSTLGELMKLDGFLHSSFWEPGMTHLQLLQECESFSYDEMISCPEDVYERLVENGCTKHVAISISNKIQAKNKRLELDDLITLTDYCGEDYMRTAEKIEHLYYRAQIFEMSIVTAQMMYYININFSDFKIAYDKVDMWMK